MKTTDKSTVAETKCSQIPPNFRLLAKEKLKEEIKQYHPSFLLDPDQIFINIARDATISSETLLEALLKKSIGEENLLSNSSADLYSHPKNLNVENKIQGLEVKDIKRIIDHLSPILVNTYHQQVDGFWKKEQIFIPQELQVNPVDHLLKALVDRSSLIERVYQLDNMYPNLKQTVISYLSKKLKDLYQKDIDPDTARLLFFHKGEENSSPPFLEFNITEFILNYFSSWFFYWYVPLLENTTIQVESAGQVKNIELIDFVSEINASEIKSKHREKLKLFWQKNSHSYRVLAKFSYLKTLLNQQNSTSKLSKKGLELAYRAMGFNQVDFDLDLKKIPLDILETLANPHRVEVSSFIFNNQTSSDILKIHDLETNDLLLYIPGYTPSFIEANNERLLIHWVFHQVESSDNLTKIASHFPHSSRMVNSFKLDAFLYPDDIEQKENTGSTIAQEDIFSFITEKQKERVVADLYYADEIPVPVHSSSTPDYQSTDSAIFTTIAAAIESISYLLPNIHAASSDLQESFPNPYETASEFMKKEIKEKLHLDVDPDRTFIRFSLHEAKYLINDPTLPPVVKIQKAKTTVQSLTEAALNNYREGYSPLGFTTIIYQDLSGKGQEPLASDQLLNILPKDIEEIIQKADLDALHKSKLDSFWDNHADKVKYFTKYRYLQQALEEYQNKTLSEESFTLVSEVAFYSLALEEGELPGLIHPNIRIEIVSVDGYQSTDIFVFRDTSKEQALLYIAGNSRAFFTFKNYKACICFLEENAKKNLTWQKLLSSHFSMDVQDPVIKRLKIGSYTIELTPRLGISLLPTDCSSKDANARHPITTTPIEKSLFEAMQKNIQERSYADANVVITSDKELMLRRIVNIVESIEMLLLVPSLAFPVLNWGVLAALATETVLNLYIAKNGDTVKERHQAALSAGVSSVEFILIGAFLHFRSLRFSKNQTLSEISMQEDVRSRPVIGGRGVSPFLEKKPLSEEPFFGTTEEPMMVWNITASDRQFSHLDVKAWFVDDQFLLFTGKANKANHLIISTHGGYFPRSGIVKVPENTELVVLGPHGWALVDPKTANIAKGLVRPYGIINENTAIPAQTAFLPSLFSRSSNIHLHPKTTDIKILSGTNVPGHIKNYSLAKYQKFGAGQESYLDIAQIVSHSRHPFPTIYGIGTKPVDVLTVRNRKGMFFPNLKDVFECLERHGIHYDKITLEFCRSNINLSKLGPVPKYKPAML